jgi:SAM-dependent methyltransferase
MTGYEIRPIRPAPVDPFPIDAAEAAEIDRELHAFARQHPSCGMWSRPEEARGYLTSKRVTFYHDLLAKCEEHGLVLDDRTIADVGSGPGYLFRLIHRQAPSARLTGYDTYLDLMQLARHLCPAAQFVEQDLFEVTDSGYDIVYCCEVLEHLIDPGDALERLIAMVGPGGRLVLTVPDGRHDSFAANGPYQNGRGYWGHIHFWSPESWRLFIGSHASRRDFRCGQLVTGENYAILSDGSA